MDAENRGRLDPWGEWSGWAEWIRFARLIRHHPLLMSRSVAAPGAEQAFASSAVGRLYAILVTLMR
jgi:hypothetical protein